MTDFLDLHHRDGPPLLLPNPWDVGSARYLQHLGFPALATTSAGFAFSQGLPDSGDEVVLSPPAAHEPARARLQRRPRAGARLGGIEVEDRRLAAATCRRRVEHCYCFANVAI